MDLKIIPARSGDDMQVVAQLFTSYADALGVDLTFQNFAAELAGLPGKYAPPHGELLLAYGKDGTTAVGCVALQSLAPAPGDGKDGASSRTAKCCEMKRLYVAPAARGTGLGRLLVESIVEQARALGYDEMRLDTLEYMARARELYRRLGFVEIVAYYSTPLAGTKFLSLDLTKAPELSLGP